MKRFALPGLMALAVTLVAGKASTQDPKDVPKDSRLGPAKTLNSYFPFTPPTSREEWEKRRAQLREQVLVANGLWPLPEKTPLKSVIHGKIDRDEYTIEKVFFASYPGHYVCGNLYRPKGKSGKLPGILSPHGHWPNGRFYDAGEKAATEQIKQGAEKTIAGARHPLQARCAQLARMGCVVFHYDMVGYADSTLIKHREGFTDPEAELRLQSFMGLQTWNCIRALDFLIGLPDVDPARIGVTGASGGGTQTFILCAIDDRPAAAFPAVMVSTGMQGGCICENCSYLRVGTGNVELAGMFAPKPLAMSGANDWTKEIESKGLPELKTLYKLYGAEDRVMAKALVQFGHNYNQVSRELMYNWFNKHLKLGHADPVTEKPFVPVPPKELSVFDEKHPLPKDAVGVHELRNYMTRSSQQQLAGLIPSDAERPKEMGRVLGPALRAMVNDTLPGPLQVTLVATGAEEVQDGVKVLKYYVSRKGEGEAVPMVIVRGQDVHETGVVWVHPQGAASLWKDGKLVPEARALVNRKAMIVAVDVFLTGEAAAPAVDKRYAGYTFGYNRPLVANRVHDILTVVARVKDAFTLKKIHLVGFDKAGPWVVLARARCGDAVARTAADMNQFRFEQILSNQDEMMLPGALKYGGMPALTALCAPGELFLHNDAGSDEWLRAAYRAAGAPDRLRRQETKAATVDVVNWLLR